MSFFTVSHWEAKTWNKEDEAKASEKYSRFVVVLVEPGFLADGFEFPKGNIEQPSRTRPTNIKIM